MCARTLIASIRLKLLAQKCFHVDMDAKVFEVKSNVFLV